MSSLLLPIQTTGFSIGASSVELTRAKYANTGLGCQVPQPRQVGRDVDRSDPNGAEDAHVRQLAGRAEVVDRRRRHRKPRRDLANGQKVMHLWTFFQAEGRRFEPGFPLQSIPKYPSVSRRRQSHRAPRGPRRGQGGRRDQRDAPHRQRPHRPSVRRGTLRARCARCERSDCRSTVRCVPEARSMISNPC
jgi:hypothetical protein